MRVYYLHMATNLVWKAW